MNREPWSWKAPWSAIPGVPTFVLVLLFAATDFEDTYQDERAAVVGVGVLLTVAVAVYDLRRKRAWAAVLLGLAALLLLWALVIFLSVRALDGD